MFFKNMEQQMNALMCSQEVLESSGIPSSSHKLDKSIGHGFRIGTLSEIVGSSSSGKTQLCLQLTVNTILPVPTGLIDGEVIYISTKQNFLPQRLDQLLDKCIRIWKSSAQHKEVSSSKIVFTKEEALKKIYPFRVLSLPELIASIYKAQQLIESNFNKNVRLIIVDSFATFLIDLEPLERVRIIYELLHILQETATRFGCAVVLTNDMTTHITTDNNKESLFQSQALKPALGETFLHRIQQRIVLTKSQKDPQVVIASVQKNVNGGPSLVRFRITRDGIEDVS